MPEQEYTAGDKTGDRTSSADGGERKEQSARRHSWGSKSSRGAATQDNRETDRTNPRESKNNSAASDRRTPPSGADRRAASSERSGAAEDRGGQQPRGPQRGGNRNEGVRGRGAGGPDGTSSRRDQEQGRPRSGERSAGRRDDRRDRTGGPERGEQLRGAASRNGTASGRASDGRSRPSSAGGASSSRGAAGGRGGSWGPRPDGERRPNDRSTSARRPTDRRERSAGGERPRVDRAPDTGGVEGPRTHNARDLRSANRPDRERSPEIDEDVKGDELDRVTRAQVRNLEERSAVWVAKHLVMAGRLIDLDPELAFQHALAASRRGGRLAAVREAVGLTAYAAGHYGEALREFRTFRRISGSNVHLPVMADCERGLGRPDRALDVARSEEADSLDAAGKAELAMVVSGARSDLGQPDAALAALEIPQLDLHRAFSFSPRLFRAYADALSAVGRGGESDVWRRQASVAEKALGLDDDLEPDIVDLGEDDDEPFSVPQVGDVLETPDITELSEEIGDGHGTSIIAADAPEDGAGSDSVVDGSEDGMEHDGERDSTDVGQPRSASKGGAVQDDGIDD